MITFNIDNNSYQAEEGMTWGEWVESEYNTGNFVISNGWISIYGATNTYVSYNGYYMTPSSVISETNYTIGSGGSN